MVAVVVGAWFSRLAMGWSFYRLLAGASVECCARWLVGWLVGLGLFFCLGLGQVLRLSVARGGWLVGAFSLFLLRLGAHCLAEVWGGGGVGDLGGAPPRTCPQPKQKQKGPNQPTNQPPRATLNRSTCPQPKQKKRPQPTNRPTTARNTQPKHLPQT